MNIFWFRRDLRLDDNHALFRALQTGNPVQCIFIFDDNILDELPADDARVNFIYQSLKTIHLKLKDHGSSLLVLKGNPIDEFEKLFANSSITGVYTNHDYEPYAIERDDLVQELSKSRDIPFNTYKDQVIFEKSEVVKDDGKPYTVYTPFMKKWTARLTDKDLESFDNLSLLSQLNKSDFNFPDLDALGFKKSDIQVLAFDLGDGIITSYEKTRNFPFLKGTSNISPHLRFGTVSIRRIASLAKQKNFVYLKELIWREFFMQILYHFPQVVQQSFRPKYDKIPWRNNNEEYEKWCLGETGYPMVDAGMRQLNATGYMHNRVRMVVASFLCKHLLIDWRWGESYFAKKLLDYELSSNNGNWQWAAGTGCDAAPYFRVFNPTTQIQKFDKDLLYIRKWIPELDSLSYPTPIVEHKMARERAIATYKEALTDN